MSDHFEKAKDDILKRTVGNGGPTPLDLLDALQGLADDMDDKHTENVGSIDELKTTVAKHLDEAAVRDRRIRGLEAKVIRWEEECPVRLEAVIETAVARSEAKHQDHHNKYLSSITKPRRKDDAGGKDYRKDREESRQVWLMWMVGSKVTYVLLAVIVTALNFAVHYLLMGEP